MDAGLALRLGLSSFTLQAFGMSRQDSAEVAFASGAGVLIVGRIIRKTGRASIIVLILSVLIIIG